MELFFNRLGLRVNFRKIEGLFSKIARVDRYEKTFNSGQTDLGRWIRI